MTRKKTNEEFLIELKDRRPDLLPLEPYDGAQKKILVKSLKCGHSWSARPNDMFHGYGCPVCAGTKKLTNEEFVLRLKEVNDTDAAHLGAVL